MSHYATELEPATTYIHAADFPWLLDKIKQEVETERWEMYGWQPAVLDAERLEEVAKEFGITLINKYGDYYYPMINGIYVSSFFDDLIYISAPYMTNGKIRVDDEYGVLTIKYEDGEVDTTFTEHKR